MICQVRPYSYAVNQNCTYHRRNSVNATWGAVQWCDQWRPFLAFARTVHTVPIDHRHVFLTCALSDSTAHSSVDYLDSFRGTSWPINPAGLNLGTTNNGWCLSIILNIDTGSKSSPAGIPTWSSVTSLSYVCSPSTISEVP